MPRKLIYHLYVIYFSMTISKNEGIGKDDNNNDKQYQERKDFIISFFRKLKKIEFWTYMAYVIVLTICFQSVMVMVLNLLFLGYFGKLWRICDLISLYYLSAENCPCYLWIEIFDKLRICCWVWPNVCWGNFGKLLLKFFAKSKLQFCKKIIHVSCKVNVCYFWLLRVQIRIWPYFSPRYFGKFYFHFVFVFVIF